ncbi:MAG: 4Fe-4S binding protein [Clostridiales bacterium]|nr:4Fe-4S binding protein [Clostridiales bacterium]
MKIAVLSGKGGTGKTFVSVNLACAADKATYADCDVEEPNGHLFFKPVIIDKTAVTVKVPLLDQDRCTRCRKCVDFCRYNALALIKDQLMIFYEMCHSCGGCVIVCPEGALTEEEREIGALEEGLSDEISVITGRMNIGEVSGVPIINEIVKRLPEEDISVIDCPPGSACVVMESIRDADYCILVTEPTLFGVHNLAMVYDLVKLFNKPFGVILNKCMSGENPAEEFCVEKGISILAKIPFDKELGRLNSQGLIAVREDRLYRELFQGILFTIEREVSP